MERQKQRIMDKILNVIDSDRTNLYGVKEFQFLIDMAQMAIDVRRGLSFCYAIRFHLKGVKRQVFFDHLTENVEGSLNSL